MRPDEAVIQDVRIPRGQAMLDAMRLGVRKALQEHHERGVPIITWDAQKQEIVEIPAEQIPAWLEATTPPAE